MHRALVFPNDYGLDSTARLSGWRHRSLLAVVAISLAGLWWRAPVLGTGFIVDDYAQLSMMANTYPVARSPLALFTFSGDVAETQALKEAGFLPWWTHRDFKVALFRPLASALMWVDHLALNDDAQLFHLHSAAWWLAMSIVWGLLALRFLPAPWALFAHALCTLHPANGMLLGWIANRNASVAMLFGLAALWLQVRRRERHAPNRLDNWLIALCWALALLAGEYGLGILVFGLTYELVAEAPFRTRLSRIQPCAWVVLCYAVLRAWLQFGSRQSGMYVDPVAEPWAFLNVASLRGPVMLADLVLGLRSNWWSSGYPWAEILGRWLQRDAAWALDLRGMRAIHVGFGIASCVIAACCAWFAQKHSPKLRFAAFALPLAIIPTLGGAPESRLLLPAMFGWSLLLAQVLQTLLTQVRQRVRAHLTLALLSVSLMTALEVRVSLLYSAEDRAFLPRLARVIRQSILAPELDRALTNVEDAFLVAAVDPTTTIYIPMLRRWHGRSGPQRCHLLMSTISSMRLERLGPAEFRLSRLQEFYTPPDVYAEAFRREPLREGETLATRSLVATVEQVHNGMPTVVRFSAQRNLDDAAITLLIQDNTGVLPLRFPPVGQSVMFTPASFPLGLLTDN